MVTAVVVFIATNAVFVAGVLSVVVNDFHVRVRDGVGVVCLLLTAPVFGDVVGLCQCRCPCCCRCWCCQCRSLSLTTCRFVSVSALSVSALSLLA